MARGGRTHPMGKPDGDGGVHAHPTVTAVVDLDYLPDLNRTANSHVETMMLTDAPLLYTPGQIFGKCFCQGNTLFVWSNNQSHG